MKKLLMLLLLLVLAACGSAEPPTNAPGAQEADNTPDGENAVVEAEETGEETAVANPDTPITNDAAMTPATTPAEAAQVRSQDWTLGADDPLVTIIEYGDFQ